MRRRVGSANAVPTPSSVSSARASVSPMDPMVQPCLNPGKAVPRGSGPDDRANRLVEVEVGDGAQERGVEGEDPAVLGAEPVPAAVGVTDDPDDRGVDPA